MNRILYILRNVERDFPALSKIDQARAKKVARKLVYPDTIEIAFKEGYISTTEKNYMLDSVYKWSDTPLYERIAIVTFMTQYRLKSLRRLWFWRKWI